MEEVGDAMKQLGADIPPAQGYLEYFTCKCKHNAGTPCSTQFCYDLLLETRLQYVELSSAEKDIVILAKVACGAHMAAETEKKRKQTARQRNQSDFYHHGKVICRDIVMFLHALSKDKLTALLKHYRVNGVCARVHKLSKKLSKNALTFDETKHVVSFIVNYAAPHSMSLPGRVPGYARDDLKQLHQADPRRWCTMIILEHLR